MTSAPSMTMGRKIPALIHSLRRSRIVVTPQPQSAIDAYEKPNRRTPPSQRGTAAVMRACVGKIVTTP